MKPNSYLDYYFVSQKQLQESSYNVRVPIIHLDREIHLFGNLVKASSDGPSSLSAEASKKFV